MWRFTDLENSRTLILGDVHTGKTQLTQKLLEEAESLKRDIAVIDMAPEKKSDIGGKLTPSSTTFYYTTEIATPRLSGKTEKEVIELAEMNKKRIDELLKEYKPRNVLFINDVSIYLQRGKVETIVSLLSSSKTCILNGYFGSSLGKDPFSLEERKKMTELQIFCHNTIWR